MLFISDFETLPKICCEIVVFLWLLLVIFDLQIINWFTYKKLFYEKTINKNSFINYIVPQIYLIFNTMSLRYVKYVKKCKSNIKATMTSTTAKKNSI